MVSKVQGMCGIVSHDTTHARAGIQLAPNDYPQVDQQSGDGSSSSADHAIMRATNQEGNAVEIALDDIDENILETNQKIEES